MISLNPEQQKYVLENFKGSIVINETRYYFKPCKTAQGDYTGIENVIERLAKIVGINCAEYDLISLDNTYYDFSKLIDPYFYLAVIAMCLNMQLYMIYGIAYLIK